MAAAVLGDALVASSGQLSPEARTAYERMNPLTEETSQLFAQAWARFRLGDTAGAAEMYRVAQVSITDPILEDRLRLVLIHHAAGGHAEAQGVLSEVLRDLADVPDPRRAGGILTEAIYFETLIKNDPRYGRTSEQAWTEVRKALEAHKRTLLTAS